MRGTDLPEKKLVWLMILLGSAMFVPMFVIQHLGGFDFWWWMSTSLLVLVSLSLLTDRNYLSLLGADLSENLFRKIMIALASVILLYFVFYFGNWISRQWFSFAGGQITGIYHFKGEASSWRIILLMALVIGPGEELFWRGFVQRHLSGRYGRLTGFFMAAAVYAAVHIATGNFMLVMAALICGLFWGWLYLRYRSMLINVLSHTLWDIAVFVVFPFS
ncbi:MAG TPA: type II CAAX endopeptidase family protein [Bacteroidales bacterium]|nr:type II CAAX endopeptidase family protein [Bacteroidales bacterium]